MMNNCTNEQWYIYSKKADFAALAAQLQVSPMLVRILRNRDIEDIESMRRFLYGTREDLYDPFLMKGMEEGVQLTQEILQQHGKIRIIGDYDVDGVCSAYILKTYLTQCGAQADVRLPDRLSEGYGMNESMAQEAARDGISLIITCDNGISAVEAIQKAREMGICVIITDHHEPPEILPPANVIIDPKQSDDTYPFRELCGASVAYKFTEALDMRRGGRQKELLDNLLQYAGMATITDIVPLQDENRIIAAEGIRRLRQTDSPGLRALMLERGLEQEHVNAGNIGFVLGPCINSAGRLRNAMIAFSLLEEKDPARAAEIAEELSMLNEERRFLTETQISSAEKAIQKSADAGQPLQPILVLYLPDAHESVAGIIAGRVKDMYNRPAFVITSAEGGLKGSGRSTEYYNMIAGLQEHRELFEKYGGHAKACGFTLQLSGSEEETVQRFSRVLNASGNIAQECLTRKVWIDMQLPFKFVTESFIHELESLEPFGLKNEKPVFAEKDILVEYAKVLGKNSNVLKLSLRDRDGYAMEGIMFADAAAIAEQYRSLPENGRISILYYPQINEFRGQRTVQLVIRAIRTS